MRDKLSALKVARLKKVGAYADGGGLYVRITRPGYKLWTFRYQIAGVAREMTFGPVTDLLLAEARELANDARKLTREGRDPIAVKKAEAEARKLEELRRVTFAQAAAQFMATDAVQKLKDHKSWRRTLEEACETIGDLPLEAIDRPLVLKALQPMNDRGAKETARRTRGRIERVFSWALACGMYAGTNPADEAALRDAMPSKPKAKHHPAMAYLEVPAFVGELRARDSVSAKALELTVLCATRTSETIGAQWSELDLDAGVWTIPGSRMKAKKDHRVPLSDRALELLRAMPRNGERVFALSNMAMLELLRGMAGNGYTVHGFRSSFSDWARDRTAYARDVVEQALAHTIKDKSERAYRRGDALDKRRRLMAEWSRFLEAPAAVGVGDNVRALRA